MASPHWTQKLCGKFIVFDGPDGSGKSTQFRRFADYCRDHGVVISEVREPGGTDIGEQIRRILLDPASEMSVRCEMLLYMASRAQLVEQIIAPALARNELVLADRFVSSTLAYQGAAGGLPMDEIMSVGRVAIGRHWPDLVVVFDVDSVSAAKRMAGGGGSSRASKSAVAVPSLFADRLELRGLDYQRRVREGFLSQAREEPERYLVVDASQEPNAVFETLTSQLSNRFK